MEILFVSHKYPPSVGGMEKQSFELINGMKPFATVHSIVCSSGQNKLLFFLVLEKRILDTLRKFPAISVIHFNDALIASFCLTHTSYNHLFTAVTVHGLDVVFPVRIYQKFVLPAFNRFNLVIAVSQATASACTDRGIAPQKLVVINNGVDHSLLDTEADKDFFESFSAGYGISLKGKTVLTVMGRPVKRKGFSWFIENVLPRLEGDFIILVIGPFNKKRLFSDRLFSSIPGVVRNKLELLLGYPTDENQVRRLLSEKRFNEKAIHLGKLSNKHLKQVLVRTDAFLMPNILVKGDMEGFGLVCLEASLCGAWVFASGIDGLTDAVHPGKNGTLIPAENISGWVSALNNFISGPANFHSLRNSGKSYTKNNFGWEKMVKSYLNVFREQLPD
ncbi:glycosyltransferase family 4 protein [Dyadobacter sp. NIV53]|uniref:glycosyltransferase family 4 protein n=1 Tax=Dyadobacter sp. NIV53 TaxID=2861765 RepID=UPI001C877234|nr:glycosyltransferase family 4 protein [Dyadobacter sp. NIV53]